MTQALLDPAGDLRAEVAEHSGVPDPLDKIWFHKTAAAVIDADRCVHCGSCVAACPSQSISIAEDGLPTLVRMCTGCSRCWDFCPMAGMRTERLWQLEDDDHFEAAGLGTVRAAYAAHALDRAPGAQDGGAVTAIVEALIANGIVDGAVVTKQTAPMQGQPMVVESLEATREAAGSIYDQSLPLTTLDAAAADGSRLAFVGTPCQINGLRMLQRFPWRQPNGADAVTVAIALLCTRSFDPQRLMLALARRGVDLSQVTRVGVHGATLRCFDADGLEVYGAPVDEFGEAALRGCAECVDFSGRLADISVGSVGSADGETTVLVRTAAGEAAWGIASGRLAIEEGCDLEAVARQERANRRRAARTRLRPFDADAPLWMSYGDHLECYTGTDRAPVTPPGHRSHHYLTAC